MARGTEAKTLSWQDILTEGDHMARAYLGGGVADWVFGVFELAGRQLVDLEPATLTLWSARVGGTQYTDLLLEGVAVTSIPVGEDGQVPQFQGPDGITSVWADAGGVRVLMANVESLVAQAINVGSVLATENGDGTVTLTVAGGSAWTVVDNGDGTANVSLAGQSAVLGQSGAAPPETTFADLGREPGVDPTGVTECAGAINTALAVHAAAGKRTYARGTFKIGSTVTIAHNVDMGDALFNYTGSGTAVVIGTTTSGAWVEHRHIVAPRLDNWSSGTVGIEVCNLASSYVEIPYVRVFETNLLVSGRGQGNVHNTFILGDLYNGLVNLRLWADATGWSNSNLFVGGRFGHSSGYGTNVINTHHIQMAITTNKINNNLFLNPSLEGDAPQYHVAFSGLWNVIHNGRWESPGGARVRWESDASENRIVGGYNARLIVEFDNALAQPGGNTIECGRRAWRTGTVAPNGAVRGMAGDLYTNENGGAGTTLWVKESGAQTNTGWVSK